MRASQRHLIDEHHEDVAVAVRVMLSLGRLGIGDKDLAADTALHPLGAGGIRSKRAIGLLRANRHLVDVVGADCSGLGIGLVVRAADSLGLNPCRKAVDFIDDAEIAFQGRRFAADIAFEQGVALAAVGERVGSLLASPAYAGGWHTELRASGILAGVVLNASMLRRNPWRGVRSGRFGNRLLL